MTSRRIVRGRQSQLLCGRDSYVVEREVATEADLVNACRKLAIALGCYLELISQRGGRGSGTTVGAPDAFLYCSGRVVPVEFKVGRNQLSEQQAACYAKRLDQHVETAVVRDEGAFIDVINSCRKRPT